MNFETITVIFFVPWTCLYMFLWQQVLYLFRNSFIAQRIKSHFNAIELKFSFIAIWVEYTFASNSSEQSACNPTYFVNLNSWIIKNYFLCINLFIQQQESNDNSIQNYSKKVFWLFRIDKTIFSISCNEKESILCQYPISVFR